MKLCLELDERPDVRYIMVKDIDFNKSLVCISSIPILTGAQRISFDGLYLFHGNHIEKEYYEKMDIKIIGVDII